MGVQFAMAVTVAVEEVIGEHYNSQLREMIERNYGEDPEDKKLRQVYAFLESNSCNH